MERVRAERERLRPGRLDVMLTVVVGVLAGSTVLVLADPELQLVVTDRTLDLSLNALTTLASASLAALGWVRYQEGARLSSLFQASGLFLLSILTGLHVLLHVSRVEGRFGFTLGLPGQFPVYFEAVGWLFAALLFLAGSIASVRGVRARPQAARRLLFAPPLILGVIAVSLLPFGDSLPALIGDEGIRALIEEPETASPLPGIQPLLMGFVALTTTLFVVAAVLLRFTYARGGPVTDGFLSVGLVVAAFVQLHFALFPGVYTAVLTTGDALRLGFYGALLLGIDAEARSDLRALRAAYAALDRLRVTEAERAALEERTRLAREIHDGLAQHLWFAKLKHERLAPLVPEQARALSSEVGQALDAAIVEARQALVTMRSGGNPEQPLSELIEQLADDFANRSGLRVDVAADQGLAALPARQQAELLRIIQEALTNVGKHADATMVRVRAAMDGDEVVITVSDNGRGFDPGRRGEGLGIRGMEERARLMGGELRISSEPSDGTVVRLRVHAGAVTSIEDEIDATTGEHEASVLPEADVSPSRAALIGRTPGTP